MRFYLIFFFSLQVRWQIYHKMCKLFKNKHKLTLRPAGAFRIAAILLTTNAAPLWG